MPKRKELFLKLTNYKEELEIIIENKKFSTEVENLLSNMLYKIENSYNDYEMVKKIVDEKNDLIENILESIKECKDIKLLKPTSDRMKELKKQNLKFKVDQRNKTIETFPDEKSLLEALYNIKLEKRIYISEKYSELRNSLPYVIQTGRNNTRTEIIRDFNAWSWNTEIEEIKNIQCNLIYTNLELLFGKEFMNEWLSLDENKDIIEVLKKELNEYFKTDREIREFMLLLFKISIIIYCKEDDKEKKRLEEDFKYNTEEIEKLRDTEKLIDSVSKKKQKDSKQIEKIDKILNNRQLLSKELEKHNLNKENTLLDENEFIINLKKRRKKLQKDIKDSNKLLEPNYYSNYKRQIENNLVNLVAVTELEKENEYMIKFQKYFIKGLKNKIMQSNNKKEIINMLYIIRYYNFVPYSSEYFIKDTNEIKSDLNNIEELLLNKLEENNMVNKFSNMYKFDNKLIKKIFKLRIINLEKIYMEFKKGEKIKIILYDDDTIEKGFEVKANDIKILKYNKRIKMFA